MIPSRAVLMMSVVLHLNRRGRSFSQSHRHRSVGRDAPGKVAVIGGGLAGLATVFHILEKRPETEVTVFDKTAIGTGGASSVAGGYVETVRAYRSARGMLLTVKDDSHLSSVIIKQYLLLFSEFLTREECIHQDL